MLFGSNGAMQEIKNVVLPLYCKIVDFGYAMNSSPAAIISMPDEHGMQEVCVMSDEPSIHKRDHMRPISEKFGIGTYYIDSMECYEASEVLPYVFKAREAETRFIEAAERAKLEGDIFRAKGKKLFEDNMPSDALYLIVAEFRESDRDPYADYSNASTKRRVILAFSSKKKDDFNELRKAAANCDIEEIRKFSVKPTQPEDAYEGWKPEDEHREVYTGGYGNYLGDYARSSGVVIQKLKYIDLKKCSDLWKDAGKEGGFYAFKEVKEAKTTNVPSVEGPTGEVNIIDYSEKSIAVTGQTYPIREQLKEMGGKFNKFLSCGAGWVFPKSKIGELTNFLTNQTV